MEGARFIGESGSGHSVVMDGPPDHGGQNLGVRPMEMILLGLGGCAAFDVVNILRKSRQPVRGCEVSLAAERAEGVPSPFVKIELTFTVRGAGVDQAQAERAVKLSAEKYCSASIMLGRAGVELTHKVIVAEDAA